MKTLTIEELREAAVFYRADSARRAQLAKERKEAPARAKKELQEFLESEEGKAALDLLAASDDSIVVLSRTDEKLTGGELTKLGLNHRGLFVQGEHDPLFLEVPPDIFVDTYVGLDNKPERIMETIRQELVEIVVSAPNPR